VTEVDLLLWIRGWASPALDAVFLFSHLIGTFYFLVPFVLLIAARHARRGERPEARAWIVVGLSTYFLQEALKLAFGRPRPDLWPPLVDVASAAFPSGHALATATIFPLLAWTTGHRRSRLARPTMAVALGLVGLVGVGRLYLGVHWPSDVLGGWAIGGLQCWAATRWLTSVSERTPG
jgi:undecaprenyl-diphosphatase